jgi:hypothetical protein
MIFVSAAQKAAPPSWGAALLVVALPMMEFSERPAESFQKDRFAC